MKNCDPFVFGPAAQDTEVQCEGRLDKQVRLRSKRRTISHRKDAGLGVLQAEVFVPEPASEGEREGVRGGGRSKAWLYY